MVPAHPVLADGNEAKLRDGFGGPVAAKHPQRILDRRLADGLSGGRQDT